MVRPKMFVLTMIVFLTWSAQLSAPAHATPSTQTTDGTYRVYIPMTISGSSQHSGGGPAQSAEALEVLRLTNEYRARHGCEPFTLSPELAAAAQAHTLDMTRMGRTISHTGTNGSTLGTRLAQVGYNFQTAAENIAAGYTSPAEVVEAWYTSDGHRENMINCEMREIGIGHVYDTTSSFDYYWTQDFGTRWP
jgi:uncharacterized protein YkwD